MTRAASCSAKKDSPPVHLNEKERRVLLLQVESYTPPCEIYPPCVALSCGVRLPSRADGDVDGTLIALINLK